MEITSLGWVGTRTARCDELASFYKDVLGSSWCTTNQGSGSTSFPTVATSKSSRPTIRARRISQRDRSSISRCGTSLKQSTNSGTPESNSSVRQGRHGSNSEAPTATFTSSLLTDHVPQAER